MVAALLRELKKIDGITLHCELYRRRLIIKLPLCRLCARVAGDAGKIVTTLEVSAKVALRLGGRLGQLRLDRYDVGWLARQTDCAEYEHLTIEAFLRFVSRLRGQIDLAVEKAGERLWAAILRKKADGAQLEYGSATKNSDARDNSSARGSAAKNNDRLVASLAAAGLPAEGQAAC